MTLALDKRLDWRNGYSSCERNRRISEEE